MTPGDHLAAYSFVYPAGESALSPSLLRTTVTGGRILFASGFGLPVGATSAKFYLTTAGGSTFFLVGSASSSPFNLNFTSADSALVTAYVGGLASGPTYPYGGTPLGYASGCAVVKNTEFAYAMSESRGSNRAKTYRGGTDAQLAFNMLQFDTTVYDRLWAFDTSSAGGYQGANNLYLPQVGRSLQPGLVAPSANVLFAPDNPQHPATILYAPAWCDETRQRLALQLNRPLESLVVLIAGLDAAGRDLQIAKLQDLAV